MSPSAINRLPEWAKKVIPSLLGGSIVVLLENQALELVKHAIYGWVVERIEETIGRHATTIIAFVASYAPAILAAVLVYFMMSVVLASTRKQKDDAGARIAISSNEEAYNIIIGSGGHYESKTASGLYKTKHTFAVGVKNTSSDQFLSNCRVYLDIPDEGGVAPKSYLLVDTFTLSASEERLVPIISYDEPATVSGHKGSTIQLHIPGHGGYYDVGWGWPWRLPIGAYTFTLRATSKEAGARELVCKAWVDNSGKLHFEKA